MLLVLLVLLRKLCLPLPIIKQLLVSNMPLLVVLLLLCGLTGCPAAALVRAAALPQALTGSSTLTATIAAAAVALAWGALLPAAMVPPAVAPAAAAAAVFVSGAALPYARQ
jgi:hypothetical protein